MEKICVKKLKFKNKLNFYIGKNSIKLTFFESEFELPELKLDFFALFELKIKFFGSKLEVMWQMQNSNIEMNMRRILIIKFRGSTIN